MTDVKMHFAPNQQPLRRPPLGGIKTGSLPNWPLPSEERLTGAIGEAIERIRALHLNWPNFARKTLNKMAEIEADHRLSDAAKDEDIIALALGAVREAMRLMDEPVAKLRAQIPALEKQARDKIAEAGGALGADRGDEIRSWLRGLSKEDRREFFHLARNGKLPGGDELLLAVLAQPLSPYMAGFTVSEVEITVGPAVADWRLGVAAAEVKRIADINAAIETGRKGVLWVEDQMRAQVGFDRYTEAARSGWRSLTDAEKRQRIADMPEDKRAASRQAYALGSIVK